MTAAVIAWCSNEEETTTPNTTPEVNLSCQSAIQTYLSWADMKWRGDKEIKAWDAIVVDYVGRLSESEVFDTSVESIAKACGKYTEGRNYNEWLPFTVGAWQMIAGFDKGVEGMKIGQTKTITIPAAEAYWERSKDRLITVEKTTVPNAEQYEVWMQVQTDYGQAFKVYKVTDTQIIFDGNHELAGKDLTFDITIKEIK